MANLKPGWRRVKFGEVVRLNKETCKNPAAEGIDRYIGLEHLEPGDLRIRSWGDVSDGTTFTNRVRAGQVLFGKRRAYQRKVAVADFDAVCSGDIYVFESTNPDRLLPDLLPFLCQTDSFFEYAVGTSAGSLSPRTNWTSLAEYEFALPPMEEQRSLASVLNSMANARDAASTTTRTADKLRKSYLLSVFRPKHGNQDQYPSRWHIGTVDDAGEVQLGQKRDPSVHFGANMRPYLRVANVFDDSFDLSDVLSMNFADRDLPKYLLRVGDILLNEGQSADLLGRSAIWNGQVESMYFQMTLLRFRCREFIIPEFAHAFFQHLLYTKQFAKEALQTTSIAHLSASKFGRMTFPVPPMSDQEAIVRDYGVLRDAHRAAQARDRGIKNLSRSLMSQAFSP